MRLVAHISDLHFGRHDPAAAEGLLVDLAHLSPDLVAISGDLTQRARRREFIAARAFLEHIAAPLIVVPGNHDVPLYNLARRLLRPLSRFRRYISSERLPLFVDDEIAVLGINTARVAALANGRVSHEQIAEIRRVFGTMRSGAFRILVSHHPLTNPPHLPDRTLAGRAHHAMGEIADSGVDLLLAGHFHQAFTHAAAAPYRMAARRSVLVSQAGTAVSTRLREEVNSYNLIHIAGTQVTCQQRDWTGRRFTLAAERHYRHAAGHWSEIG